MKTIVCAVRGGKNSEPTVDGAIALARDSAARLVFVYVIDAEFLAHATVGRHSITMPQLQAMAEFILLTMQVRAEEEGVSAEYAIREGQVQEQIREYVLDAHPDILVMGKPSHQEGDDLFTHPVQNAFVQSLEEEAGVQVILM
ncbi:MAG: universal stress protein [Chloroflexi bacterium]|nr:universal stress protein [Chloroflexota bacterium]